MALAADVDLSGDEIAFVALPDGSFVVEHGRGDPARLARALDLRPPYRAEAVRRGASTWAVAAVEISVHELGPASLGDEIEIAWDGVERSTRIDGMPTIASVPALEAVAAGRHDRWVARARRLRDSFWELEIDPL